MVGIWESGESGLTPDGKNLKDKLRQLFYHI